MATVKIALPLTTTKVWSLANQLGACRSDEPSLYFTVDNGELIVSTEPLGDDPSVNPQIEGVYTP